MGRIRRLLRARSLRTRCGRPVYRRHRPAAAPGPAARSGSGRLGIGEDGETAFGVDGRIEGGRRNGGGVPPGPARQGWAIRCSRSATGRLGSSGRSGMRDCRKLGRGAGASIRSDEAIAEHDGELGLSLGPSAGGISIAQRPAQDQENQPAAASSLGKRPLARTARRSSAFKASIGFVV